MKFRLFSLTVLFVSPLVEAHHSRTVEYNTPITELEGVVERVLWRNPHVLVTLSVTTDSGETDLWELEGTAPRFLERNGVPRDVIEVGSHVTVAGNLSTRRDRRMFVWNMLMPGDIELLLLGAASPRWSQRVLGEGITVSPDADEPAEFFSVWRSTGGDRPDFIDNPPFTEFGRSAHANYDLFDDPVLDCTLPGMPRIMTRSTGNLHEFVDDGDRILLRSEDSGLVREIHMMPPAGVDSIEHTPLGHSVGRWENDDSLVVTTTHIDWPYFQLYGFEGAPQSRSTEITERFTLYPERQEMSYDIIANDSQVFTEPVSALNYRVFRWEPDRVLADYGECVHDFPE